MGLGLLHWLRLRLLLLRLLIVACVRNRLTHWFNYRVTEGISFKHLYPSEDVLLEFNYIAVDHDVIKLHEFGWNFRIR